MPPKCKHGLVLKGRRGKPRKPTCRKAPQGFDKFGKPIKFTPAFFEGLAINAESRLIEAQGRTEQAILESDILNLQSGIQSAAAKAGQGPPLLLLAGGAGLFLFLITRK